MKSVDTIRQEFLDFFQARGHEVVRSAPVVPNDDPTLLFTNAGMNQFKDVFLGTGSRPYTRAADTQKCIRAGGKHNDLEEVGRDTYHHTFFEMLGNWSFGDYYKREAISWAWELLTEVWKLDKTRLYATIHHSDDEAGELWAEVTDIAHDRILRFGDKDNFWEMGDTGPCGPCTEIHYDLGPGPDDDPSIDGKDLVNAGTERVIEIWNLVFIQNQRHADGSLSELPAKHVDTGMGLERVTAVLQGKRSNYDTDIFMPLIEAIAELTGQPYDPGIEGRRHRAIADHLRALSSSIADGAAIDKGGRDYVLRRICRRACRFLSELGLEGAGLYKLVPALVKQLGATFPELAQRQAHIESVIRAEELLFGNTLKSGLKRFNDAVAQLGDATTVDGETAWDLHQTYGFSIDLTRQMAEERGLTVDEAGFEARLEKERDTGRKTQTFNKAALDRFDILEGGSEFKGYESYELVGATVLQATDEEIILDRTPFYPEGGGPKGDRGVLVGDSFEFQVEDTQRHGALIVHCGRYRKGGPLQAKGPVTARVDRGERDAIRRNHTGTHLLHWALREVLGEGVSQQGSVIKPEGFTFDFTHREGLKEAQLEEIERLINEKILMNDPVATAEMGLDEAKAKGAVALFGEKYGDDVRVLSIGDGYSTELCGGIHCERTGDIGSLKIVKESGVSAGVRRVEAVTGAYAFELMLEQHRVIQDLVRELRAQSSGELRAKVGELKKKVKGLEKELKTASTKKVSPKDVLGQAESFGELRAIVSTIEGDANALRVVGDAIKAQETPTIGVLMAPNKKGVMLIAAVTNDLVGQGWNAGELLKVAATVLGGGGGGRPDFAQGKGQHPEKVDDACAAVLAHIKEKVGA